MGIMDNKLMNKYVKQHLILKEKVKKKFDVNDIQANKAIDIVCDFNIENNNEMFELLAPICHTLKRIDYEE